MIFDVYRLMKLIGYWRIQVVSLKLPRANVIAMLPDGIALGEAPGVDPGYHPVRLYFNSVVATMSFPPGFPTIIYSEHVTGIPYTYRTSTPYRGAYDGPFYYMPHVWTSTNWGGVMALGGRPFWGIPKTLGRFTSDDPELSPPPWWGGPLDAGIGRHYVQLAEPYGDVILSDNISLHDNRILGLDWDAAEPYFPVDSERGKSEFFRQREIMDQPLLMRFPMGVGPWWVACNFRMTWRSAFIRSIRARASVYRSYVSGMPVGSYEGPPLGEQGPDPDPEVATLGSYQLYCPFELSSISSSDTVRWTYPATTLLGPPGTAGVPSGF